jgi:hypothetical protein
MKIATNERLFRMTCQLWKEAYCHDGESLEDMLPTTEQDADNSFKWHPYGSFDCSRGHLVSTDCSKVIKVDVQSYSFTDFVLVKNKYIDMKRSHQRTTNRCQETS